MADSPQLRARAHGNTLVSVVVPFYNEDENVGILAEEIAGVFARIPQYDYECLFVNDGSTDRTGERIDALAVSDAHFRPLHLVENTGQSAALLAGMREARGAFIVTLDGDLQNDPADFPRVLELLEEYDCVCGLRTARKDTWIRRISSKIANSVRQFALADGIHDAGCGIKGFRRACLAHFPAFDGVHRFFAVFVRNAGLTLVECPVNHRPRQHGVSKYGIHNRLWRGLYDLFGVRWLRRRAMAIQTRTETPGSLDPEGPSVGEDG